MVVVFVIVCVRVRVRVFFVCDDNRKKELEKRKFDNFSFFLSLSFYLVDYCFVTLDIFYVL